MDQISSISILGNSKVKGAFNPRLLPHQHTFQDPCKCNQAKLLKKRCASSLTHILKKVLSTRMMTNFAILANKMKCTSNSWVDPGSSIISEKHAAYRYSM
ncbi:hypothetical protein XELAEV_18028723mg [Xenopus laevis]|uniref:Uncharacterized protein n=1 Tax=Xenopus laevis TaxID=8355 RepID=A0A974CRZ2_XENLA|nr:hypothetical protein XELAEV_18028723mg [Xenopus laevis]